MWKGVHISSPFAISGAPWELFEAKGPLKDHAYYDELLEDSK